MLKKAPSMVVTERYIKGVKEHGKQIWQLQRAIWLLRATGRTSCTGQEAIELRLIQ